LATHYLVDTNIVTALANKNQIALAHLQSLAPDDEVSTCFVVIGEWEYGVLNAAGKIRQATIRAAGQIVFAALSSIWESTPEIALAYGSIAAQLRVMGQLIPTNDIWIAATAQFYHAALVTSDPYFLRIPGLIVVNWLQP